MPIALRPESDVHRDYLFQCGAVASNLRASGNDAEDYPCGVGEAPDYHRVREWHSQTEDCCY